MRNETWPEFVTDAEDAIAQDGSGTDRTGWETVVFELEDDEVEALLSALDGPREK